MSGLDKFSRRALAAAIRWLAAPRAAIPTSAHAAHCTLTQTLPCKRQMSYTETLYYLRHGVQPVVRGPQRAMAVPQEEDNAFFNQSKQRVYEETASILIVHPLHA